MTLFDQTLRSESVTPCRSCSQIPHCRQTVLTSLPPFTSSLALAKRANGKWTAQVPTAQTAHVLFMSTGLSCHTPYERTSSGLSETPTAVLHDIFCFTRRCAPILPGSGVIIVMAKRDGIAWLCCCFLPRCIHCMRSCPH